MLQRQLKTLNYQKCDNFNPDDPQQFRQLVNWLETSKLRTGKGFALKDTYATNWDNEFKDYLKNIGCPVELYCDVSSFNAGTVTWLVGLAVKLQYSTRARELNDKSSAFMMISDGTSPNKKMKTVSSNPIESLDFQSTDFREGVRRLADLLKVNQSHPDHLVTLEACCKIIRTRLSQKNMKNITHLSNKGESFELKDHNLGVPADIKDPVLKEAVKILRLIHLNNLRDLQSDINATIETVQAATANPKTDTRLGKVGR
jgi:RLL motif-containing protein 1